MALPSFLRGNIVVAGAGVSGVGVARLLQGIGASFQLVDANAAALKRLADLPCASIDEHTLDDADLVVTSPGWRPDSPLLREAEARGIPVIGDVELAYRLDRAGVFGAPRTWMVVTGTNGKTTTTAMLAAMMQQGGWNANAVGNIGVSIAEAVAGERIDVLVAELSSFQLHWSSELTPDVGVLLNLADDHIDWHGSFEAYAEAKAKALRGKVAIANADDPEVSARARKLPGHTVTFTLTAPEKGQLGVSDGALQSCAFGDDHRYLAPTEGIQPAGPAGRADALAAAAAARAMGVAPEAIQAALTSFSVAGHRGQAVPNERGVLAIDNSKATNPHAADAALAGFESIVWIAGGQLKGASVDELVRAHGGRMRAAALLGCDRGVIAASLREHAPDVAILEIDEQDPKQAMHQAVQWALEQVGDHDAIVLAPAAASLDMYAGMAERGDLFAHYITALTRPLQR